MDTINKIQCCLALYNLICTRGSRKLFSSCIYENRFLNFCTISRTCAPTKRCLLGQTMPPNLEMSPDGLPCGAYKLIWYFGILRLHVLINPPLKMNTFTQSLKTICYLYFDLHLQVCLNSLMHPFDRPVYCILYIISFHADSCPQTGLLYGAYKF